MKAFIRYIALALACVMILGLAACSNQDKPTPTEAPATEPAATDAAGTAEPSDTEAPVDSTEAPAVQLPLIDGHYLLREGGALYDMSTGRMVISNVREFFPGEGNANFALLSNGELWGWNKVESAFNYGELMDVVFHPTPIHLLDDIVKAADGRALNKSGQLIVWGGELADGVWDSSTDEQKLELCKARVLLENVKDFDHDLVLMNDGTLVSISAYLYGLAEEPAEVDTGVKEICGMFVYLKEDGSVYSCVADKILMAENAEKVFVNEPCEFCYYLDEKGDLYSTDLYGVGSDAALLENVEKVVFDRRVAENIGYSYVFAITKDGKLWSIDDYNNEEHRMIAENVKNVYSDGYNTYVLMNDNSLWYYTAGSGSADGSKAEIYSDSIGGIRPNGEYTLVKVMDGVLCCGVEIDMIEGDEQSRSDLRSTFYLFTEEGRMFKWGYIEGEGTVLDPEEIFLRR